MPKRLYHRSNIEIALDHHQAQGNIGRWTRRGDGYRVDITNFPPAELRSLREAHIFVLGLGSAAKAAAYRAESAENA